MDDVCNSKRFCTAMVELSDDSHTRGRRLFITESVNLKTGLLGRAVAFQKGRNFVWLNFCPWCGGRLRKRR